MKNKVLLICCFLFFSFCFVILFKSLNNFNEYKPEAVKNEKLASFVTKDFFSGEEISSDQIFVDSDYYILNIWSSWCGPCRDEHPILMEISKNKSIKLIGINFRDNPKNAKKFIDDFGNPFSLILSDKDGTIAITLGAYGVPETTIINKDKKIIKKFVGSINNKDTISEIEFILK